MGTDQAAISSRGCSYLEIYETRAGCSRVAWRSLPERAAARHIRRRDSVERDPGGQSGIAGPLFDAIGIGFERELPLNTTIAITYANTHEFIFFGRVMGMSLCPARVRPRFQATVRFCSADPDQCS